MAAAHLAQRSQQLVARDAELVGEGEEQMLDREVLVTHVAAQLVGGIEALARGATEGRLRPPDGAGHPGQLLADAGAQRLGVRPQLGEDGPGDVVGLGEHGRHQVGGGDLGVVGGGRLLVGGREGFSGLQRPSFGVKCHDYLLRGVPRVLA